MTGSQIFPPAEGDGCEPFRNIAARLGCDEYLVLDAFRGLGSPEWEVPSHLDAVKKATHKLNEAARHADNLLWSLKRLSNEDLDGLILAGAVTYHQVEFLRDVLAGDASDLKSWAGRRNRTGGRNPAAYIVAEGMRRVFRRLRKPITFGNHPDGGPSTEFGRAVEHALGAFGVRADWRRPTEEAANKQGKRQARLTAWRVAKHHREQEVDPRLPPDLTDIDIRRETVGAQFFYVVSLTDHPEVVPLRLDFKHVRSGRVIEDYALQWATSVRSAKT